MNPRSYQQQSRDLIDGLKAVCASNGLGNDGNEYKIIVQTFLYKLLCDKFAYEMKRVALELANAADWIAAWQAMPRGQREMLELELGGDVPRLGADQLIASIFNRQAEPGFAKLWDDTLIAIAAANHDIFAVQTDDGEKVPLFDRLSEYLTGSADRRDGFVRAPFNKLVGVSFERLFEQKYDFYAALFEYLIKDYNKDNGGKYAEYYTPHAVATIMADILVPKEQRGTVKNVTCYDPASGSGTLLMALAHAIGENRCSIFAQDISQKPSSLLRLNLVLNKLVHSIPNITQGNTILRPVHKEGKALRRFDYVVSNPPFKMDFSDFRDDLDSDANASRFFAGTRTPQAAAGERHGWRESIQLCKKMDSGFCRRKAAGSPGMTMDGDGDVWTAAAADRCAAGGLRGASRCDIVIIQSRYRVTHATHTHQS